MVQKIFGIGFGGSGMVSVLVVAGILLTLSGNEFGAASVAIWSGVSIGVVLGLLGVISVANRVLR